MKERGLSEVWTGLSGVGYHSTMGNSYTYRQDSSGRVQPTATGYIAHPGQCLLCARPPIQGGEIFANLGVELEYYGVAYLCLDCCGEIANFINHKSPEQYDKIFDANIELIHKIDETQAQLERAQRLLHGRIDSVIAGEPDSDGTSSVPLSEAKSGSISLYQAFNSGKPKSSESGTK